MADNQKTPDRNVRRAWETPRLQEQLWSLAYQQILPEIRGKTRGSGNQAKHCLDEKTDGRPQKARRT